MASKNKIKLPIDTMKLSGTENIVAQIKHTIFSVNCEIEDLKKELILNNITQQSYDNKIFMLTGALIGLSKINIIGQSVYSISDQINSIINECLETLNSCKSTIINGIPVFPSEFYFYHGMISKLMIVTTVYDNVLSNYANYIPGTNTKYNP